MIDYCIHATFCNAASQVSFSPNVTKVYIFPSLNENCTKYTEWFAEWHKDLMEKKATCYMFDMHLSMYTDYPSFCGY